MNPCSTKTNESQQPTRNGRIYFRSTAEPEEWEHRRGRGKGAPPRPRKGSTATAEEWENTAKAKESMGAWPRLTPGMGAEP